GYDEVALAGRYWCQLLVAEADRPAARELVRLALAAEGTQHAVFGLQARGRRRAVAWSARALEGAGGPPRADLPGYDITHPQAAQERAVQNERLVAIGRTAAGLAHEARNALQRIQSCLSILGLRLHDQPDCPEILARAQRAQDDLSRLFNEVRD